VRRNDTTLTGLVLLVSLSVCRYYVLVKPGVVFGAMVGGGRRCKGSSIQIVMRQAEGLRDGKARQSKVSQRE
jgi:hypothetical protein